MMQHYNRSTITEEPIQDESWKDNYLDQLRRAREAGKPLKEVIDADKVQRDQLTTRYSLRREK